MNTVSNKPNEPKLLAVDENGNETKFLINPISCVNVVFEEINIKQNLNSIETWISECKPHDDKVVICSAGPSLKKFIPRIKEYREKGYKISCVKHSLKTLVDNGIVPDYCVILDPRNVSGVSTHGVKRSTLYDNAPLFTTFFVASLTDYRTTKLLKEKGHHLVGWHRYVDAMKAMPNLTPQLGGGSCAGLGSIGLFYVLGFRSMVLCGFDSSLEEGTQTKLKTFKFASKYEPQKEFLCTGELGAQAQEIEDLILKHKMVINFDVWSDGLVGNIWKHIQPKYHLPSYQSFLV
jgi:hypothetical protein